MRVLCKLIFFSIFVGIFLINIYGVFSLEPCIVVSKIDYFGTGVQVNCPEGYAITGGGFKDLSPREDDQDISKPRYNGWYCKDDNSKSECYAVCCDNSLISTKIVEKMGNQHDGISVPCDNGTVTGGGFLDASGTNDDQDFDKPLDNGWYCKEDHSSWNSKCYGVCAEPLIGEAECITVEKAGKQNLGVEVKCPSGYTITGGGFGGETSNDDDQEISKPHNNGWYCQEDNSNSNAKCYARCCRGALV